MLTGLGELFRVSRPTAAGESLASPATGEAAPAEISLGTVRGAVSARSSEEVLEDDLSRANESLIGIFSRFREPVGGFCRGLILTDSAGIRYRVLRKVTVGNHVYLKLQTAVFDGPAAAGGDA